MTATLKAAFLYWRGMNYPAHGALTRARGDTAANITRYPRAVLHGSTFGAAMDNGLRWGMPDAIGLRFVGWQDEIRTHTRDTHRGWYTQPDGWDGEVLRGCVYQFVARNGRAVFIPGYREGTQSRKGWQDTCGEHYAALHFKDLWSFADAEDAKQDAARAADSFAENAAEQSRQYNEAWSNGARYRDLRETLINTRVELRALIRELKAARFHPPAICKALRAAVADMRETMRETYRDAEKLKDEAWREYHAAFNDGAGSRVLPV